MIKHKKSIGACLIVAAMLWTGFFPAGVCAKMVFNTEVASGKLVSVTSDHIISLDDGFQYYPFQKDISIAAAPQEYVSIRYFLNDQYERVYVEAVPGKNKLKKSKPPEEIQEPKDRF